MLIGIDKDLYKAVCWIVDEDGIDSFVRLYGVMTKLSLTDREAVLMGISRST